jgi:hypothetical protein
VKVQVTPVGSAWPSRSTAHTWNACGPPLRPWTVFGLLHRLALAPSSEHKNVLWVSDDENEKLAVLEVIVPLGPLIASVRGGGICTVNVNITPVGSC